MSARAERHERARATVIEALADGDLGFTSRGQAGTFYRWWTSETEYRLLDHYERSALLDLLADGKAGHMPGWQVHRGLVIGPGHKDWGAFTFGAHARARRS